MTVNDFRRFWEAPPGKYALHRVNRPKGGEGLVIYDMTSGFIEIIDDDDLHDQVVKRMLEAGVRVTEKSPVINGE